MLATPLPLHSLPSVHHPFPQQLRCVWLFLVNNVAESDVATGCCGTTERPSTFLRKTQKLVAKELVSGRRRRGGGRVTDVKVWQRKSKVEKEKRGS